MTTEGDALLVTIALTSPVYAETSQVKSPVNPDEVVWQSREVSL